MITTSTLTAALARAPVVPVLTVDDAGQAGDLALALARGGITVAEVTLRTPDALKAISAMRDAAPQLIVGAGTILSRGDIDSARDAGSQFLVSPGASPALAEAFAAQDLIALAGVSTASEAMALAERGLVFQKFFPAEPAGGARFIKALAGPLPHITFMPTGSISLETAPDYLSAPNVVAVGGSWIVTGNDLAQGNWDAIEARAREACARLT